MLIIDLQPFQQWFTLVKSLKIKFLHPMRRSMKMLLFKMRNINGLKNGIFVQPSWGFLKSSAFRSSRPEVFYKKVVLNETKKFTGKHVSWSLFFINVASLTLLKIDSGTLVFYKFCNILKNTSFVKHISTAASENSSNQKISDVMMQK